MEIYILAGLVLLGLLAALWLVSLALGDTSIIDAFWGPGFVILNGLYLALAPQPPTSRHWVLTALVAIWGTRLACHILWRNLGKGEDYRYRKWREETGPSWWWKSFFKVFLLQGLLMWIISTPMLTAQTAGGLSDLDLLDYSAVALWTLGFLFESVGDLQLARFRSDPASTGKVLRTGLWRYTRHPNYFGDAVQWWAFYLFASRTSGEYWTVFSPILMTFLLLRVSGVTLLEQSLKKRRPEYETYIRRTSAFFPWFPSKKDPIT